MADTIPSTPDVELTTLVGTLIRAALQFLSAAFALFGATCSFCSVNASMISIVAGAAVFLGTAVWSVWQKIEAKRVDHANSVASSKASLANGFVTPVEVVKP